MESIAKILNQGDHSFEKLISCFDLVKSNGDVVVIKFDGERLEKQYTIFISFPLFKNRKLIRVDNNDLKKAMKQVLFMYINQLS